MIIFPFVFACEALLCNILLSPNLNTDCESVSLLLLAFNAILVFFLLAHVIDKRYQEADYVKNILLVSFLLRIFMLLWDIYGRDIFVLPNSEADAVWYHKIAVSYAFQGRANAVDLNDYSFYVGQLYKLIGNQKITVEFLHVFLSMWSLVLIHKITCLLDVSVKNRKRTMLIISFLPNLMLIGTVFLQESVISFCLILSLYLYTRWWVDKKPLWFLLSLLPSAAASFLHTGGIVTAVGFVVSYMLISGKDRQIKLTPFKVALGIVLIIGMLFVMTSFGDSLFGKIGGELSVEAITSSAGKSDRVSDAEYSVGIPGLPPLLDLIINSPVRMIYFICSPLPWMWRGIPDLIAFFGSALFYIYCLYLAIKTFRLAQKKDKPNYVWGMLIILIITLIIASLMFGWGVSNTGSALRHREKFTYLYAILFAVAYECIDRLEESNHEQNRLDHRPGVQGRMLPNGVYLEHL